MVTIGISLGDLTGIGPEVTLKALAQACPGTDARFVLIGDAEHIRAINRQLSLDLPLQECGPGDLDSRASVGGQRLGFSIWQPLTGHLPQQLPPGAPEAARAAVAWVRAGAEQCLAGGFDALVTAPVNKAAIVRAGVPFTGHTELLSEMAGTDRIAMMLLGTDDRGRWLRVALATTHLPLRAVADQLRPEKIELVISLAAHACAELGLPRARVAVCGLNPHAGEGGQMGTEERDIIGPAVEAARRRNLDVVGPLSADALFYYAYRGDYDAVVAMYHDQGLAPLKTVAFEHGINWTLGLPFIRTSPDHGTAYDIAGQNKANPASMLAALELALELARKKRASTAGLR